ncbi:MAG TPA: hypothetical protein VFQ47_10020 [Nitrososphaera sp.]|nr:hypothetical protein [Nitrososphaera sp.]
MPPLGRFEAGSGFIPDLAVLLMFDEFLIDGQAHERILSNTPSTWLGQWPRVLEVLGSEGALSVADVDEEVKKVAAIRGAMLKRDMQKPAIWADAMTYHDTLMAEAGRAFGESVDAAGNLTWKFDPDKIPGVQGSDGEYHILSSSPLTDPSTDPNDPHFQLHQAALSHLVTQLREVNAGLAVTNLLDTVPMFWAPYKRYLEAKSSEAEVALMAHEQAEAAHLFFSVAFPKYRPESIEALARLRNDKRLRQLRDEIIAASKSGDILDATYPQRVLEEVLKVEKKVGRVRQISGWISSAIGSIPLPGIGLAATAAGELVSNRVEKKYRRDWNWFYLISDGTGYS